MTRASLAALLLLCAGCDRHAPPAMQAKPAVAAKADDDSGQGRAEAAGRELLGRPAPALTLTTLDGQRIDLAKAYGEKPVYLKFWATWCVPCRQQMPAFEKDYQDLKDKVTIVAVNTGFNETPEGVAAYRQKLSLTMPVVIDDGRLAQALNLRVTPQHVVVGRDGRILYVGHLEDDKLHQAFAAALAEQGKPGATGAEEAREPVFRVGDQPTGLAATTTAGAPFPLTGANPDGKPRVLVFFSPWCEGYLAQSRPEASKACRRVREEVNAIAPKGQADWLGWLPASGPRPRISATIRPSPAAPRP